MITAKLKSDEEGQYVDLEAFASYIDISKVEYYTLKTEDGIIFINFYDKDKNLIKPTGE